MAKLNIEIGANASKAESVAGKLKSTFSGLASGIGGIWGKIAGAVSVGLVLGKAKETAAAMDDLKDRADNLAMPTEELQRWEYAANDAGLGSQKFGNAISKLNTLIQDAGNGSDEAVGKLTALRLDPEQLKGKSFSDQLGMVFDAISRIDDKQKALGMASQIFGEKMGKSVLGLAANWRTLKAEIPSEKIFKDEDIAAGEAFTKQMAQLDITIQKLITGSGLLQWLTKIGAAMDAIYSATPKNYNTDNASVLDSQFQTKSPVKNIGSSVNYMQLAEDGLRKEHEKEFNESLKGKNFFQRLMTPKFNPGFSKVAKEKYLDEKVPNWRNKETDIATKEAANKKNKADAAAAQIAKDAAAADKARAEWADKSYTDEIKKIQEKTAAEELLTDKKKAQAEAMKIINDLEEKRKAKGVGPLSAEQKTNITNEVQKSMTAADDSAITKQVESMKEAVAIQELLNQGKEREAFIQQKINEAEKSSSNGKLSDANSTAIKTAAGLEFDTKQAMPRDIQPQAINYVTDSALRIGGFHGGQAQYGGAVDIQRQQLDQTRSLVSVAKEIKSAMPPPSVNTNTDDSLGIGYK